MSEMNRICVDTMWHAAYNIASIIAVLVWEQTTLLFATTLHRVPNVLPFKRSAVAAEVRVMSVHDEPVDRLYVSCVL